MAHRKVKTSHIKGEVSERFKVQTWNVCVGATSPRVRIPPSPYNFNNFIM